VFERAISGGRDQGLGFYDGTANEYKMRKWSGTDNVVSGKGTDLQTGKAYVMLWLSSFCDKPAATHSSSHCTASEV